MAEGIERPAQSSALEADGCHLGQGYLFSRPLCRDAIEELLVRHRAGERRAAPLVQVAGRTDRRGAGKPASG